MDKTRLAQLVRQAQQGDSDAQQQLYMESYRNVYYLALKMLNNEQDAQDMTQEVFITVFRKLDSLEDPAAYFQWVNVVAANLCRNSLRRHKEALSDDGDEMDGLEDTDDILVMPEGALDKEETRAMILAVVENLPIKQKECVLYYYYMQLTVAQIAEILQCSEGTVKSRLSTARGKIRAELLRIEEKEGVKLYATVPLALMPLLHGAAQSMNIPQALPDTIWQSVSEGIAGTAPTAMASPVAASGAAAPATKGGVLSSLSAGAKVGIVIAVVAVAGIGVALGLTSAGRGQTTSVQQPPAMQQSATTQTASAPPAESTPPETPPQSFAPESAPEPIEPDTPVMPQQQLSNAFYERLVYDMEIIGFQTFTDASQLSNVAGYFWYFITTQHLYNDGQDWWNGNDMCYEIPIDAMQQVIGIYLDFDSFDPATHLPAYQNDWGPSGYDAASGIFYGDAMLGSWGGIRDEEISYTIEMVEPGIVRAVSHLTETGKTQTVTVRENNDGTYTLLSNTAG